MQNNQIHNLLGDWFTSFTENIFIRMNLGGNQIECSCSAMGSFVNILDDKSWLIDDKIDMDGERCQGEDGLFLDEVQQLRITKQCSLTNAEDNSDEKRERVRTYF